MKYTRYKDAKDFYNVSFPILIKHEAQNSLPLGNVVIGNKGGELDGWRNTSNWYMSTISNDDDDILLVAIMTPPFNITLYETDNLPNDEALQCLCANMFNENVFVPGVTSENMLSERFAKAYTSIAGGSYSIHKNMRIYVLNEVDKSIPLIGNIREAEKNDCYYLPYWDAWFKSDCNLGSQNLETSLTDVNRAISNKSLFVLEVDGMPVSMVSTLREIITGRCVGLVYTPPYFRNNGYASSCVAQVSKIVLDMGYKYVSLFTDLANPISNSIYQKIGYKPICDYNEVIITSNL